MWSFQAVLFTAVLLPLARTKETVRPLVIWHGLGDTYDSTGITEFISEIQSIHKGIFVHSIYIDENSKEDQKAGWFGNVTDQVDLVAHQLSCIPELEEGFDAIGFSQGGQFLRAYVQFYNNPPVHNLITYGSQHMGISDLPGCSVKDPIWCSLARSAARLGVYTTWAQDNLVQAQYFRDVDHMDHYLNSNNFLTKLNAEIELEGGENATARMKINLASLENFVMVLFTQDTTVVPKESAWFGSYALPEQDLASALKAFSFSLDFPWWRSSSSKVEFRERTIVPIRLQPIYEKDTIGIQTLDVEGRLHLESCDAVHMHLKVECWEPLVRKYVGGRLEDSAAVPFRVQSY